jgi:hypothetical protein
MKSGFEFWQELDTLILQLVIDLAETTTWRCLILESYSNWITNLYGVGSIRNSICGTIALIIAGSFLYLATAGPSLKAPPSVSSLSAKAGSISELILLCSFNRI